MPSLVESLSFRPLIRADLPMLHEWIQRPHVADWWSDSHALADVERDYLPSIDGTSSTRAFIACLGQRPVGFIQMYVVEGSGEGWWERESDPGARGIDQFLADADRLDQGLGTAMVSAFVTQIFRDPEVTKIQTDPSPENHRAIRSYTKAGFRPVGSIDTPDGPALLMVRERSDPEVLARSAI